VAGSITCNVKLWEGVRPGNATKAYGQGHWAYGKVASKDYRKHIARGGNNNTIMPDDYERLSGSTVRNGGFTGVKIEKI
jgi:anaerobic selenocysteine-containing dehydrogenase